jgi:hypothetical protein
MFEHGRACARAAFRGAAFSVRDVSGCVHKLRKLTVGHLMYLDLEPVDMHGQSRLLFGINRPLALAELSRRDGRKCAEAFKAAIAVGVFGV